MTAPEHFHETDPTGLLTLERFAEARNFNRWLFETIAPFCKGHVLEVGSGIGNISHFFLENDFSTILSDLRTEYCEALSQRFKNHHSLNGIKQVDLIHPEFDTLYADLLGYFDTIVALNVIEHIENASLAIANCSKLLKAQGHFIILVPAYQFLYNLFDEELGHYVRYNSRSLKKLLKGGPYEIIHQQYFNAVGIAGWMMNGMLFRKRLIPKKQLNIFDKMVPLIKFVDKITFNGIGLSIIAVARKTK